MSSQAVHVAVTGAGGQIGYSILFRLASGEVFGKDRKVVLHLVELPEAVKFAEGTAMEIIDCGFSTLEDVKIFDSVEKGFDGINWALLVGSKPRGPGMERADLIKENGPIFTAQGRALMKAASDIRCVVVGNPCNTNALIASANAGDVPKSRFSAMTMLDENRAKAQLAIKAGVNVSHVKKLAIWGNHSTTMYPDFENATITGSPVTGKISDRKWLEGEFLEVVQKRGAAVIAARGKSSAASAANACIDHVMKMSQKTPEGEWFSAAIHSDGNPYGVPGGIMYSFPLRSDGAGNTSIVGGLNISPFAKSKIQASANELLEERSAISNLLGNR